MKKYAIAEGKKVNFRTPATALEVFYPPLSGVLAKFIQKQLDEQAAGFRVGWLHSIQYVGFATYWQ